LRFLLTLVTGALLLGAPFAFAGALPAGFNDAEIRWHDLESGRAKAAVEGKPVFVLVHATWCPVCNEYKAVFFDPDVVAASADFVFVLIDREAEPADAESLAPDGNYIPRSMFLTKAGLVDQSLNSGRRDFRYFLDPSQPGHLLSNLQKALEKVR